MSKVYFCNDFGLFMERLRGKLICQHYKKKTHQKIPHAKSAHGKSKNK